MSALQNIAPWAVPIAALISLIAAVMGGMFLIASRKPDRMELITDGAWKLKGEAERQLNSALARITDLEGQLRALTDKLSQVESANTAQIEAAQKVHEAELLARQKVHDADMATKDGIILRLTEKVDSLELRLNQAEQKLAAAPVVTVSTTETTTTAKHIP